jgi:hypothetical protein
MIDNATLFKRDSTRRIDRVIDYFGERVSAVRRTAWLTRRRRAFSTFPVVSLERPLARDSRRTLGA